MQGAGVPPNGLRFDDLGTSHRRRGRSSAWKAEVHSVWSAPALVARASSRDAV